MLSNLTLNVKELFNHQKQLCLHQYSQTTRSSITFLQETNIIKEEDRPPERRIQYRLIIEEHNANRTNSHDIFKSQFLINNALKIDDPK